MKAQRLLLIAENPGPGGARVYLQHLLPLLCRLGWQVQLAMSRDQQDSGTAAIAARLGCALVTIPGRRESGWRTRFPFNFLLDIVPILPLLLRVRPRLIVVSNCTAGQYLGLALWPSRFLYIMHSMVEEGSPRSLKGLLLRLALGKRKRLLTVSLAARESLLRHWCGAAKKGAVAVVHNTVFGELPPPKTKERSPLQVLTLASVASVKNPRVWLQAARLVLAKKGLGRINFVWAGDGPLLTAMREQLSHKERRQIRFLGQVDQPAALLVESSVYFQPSLGENHSLAVLEAMAADLPCVVSERGGLPESVAHESTGLVAPAEDPVALAAALERLLRDKRLRRSMGKAGRQRFEEQFAPAIWEQKTSALLNQLE